MSYLRTVLEMARADFLERARRPAFLLALGGAAGLAYTVHAEVWTVRLGDYSPAAGPATTGALVAVVTSLFLSFAAFYVVKGTVDRDLRTGVGPILAATPASRVQYAAGKFLSNVAVLAAMVLLLAGLAAAVAVNRFGGVSLAGAWRVVAPSILVTAPALVAVGGVAVLFDAIPWLRGTVGNVAYFFVWTGVLTFGGFDTGSAWADVTGVNLVFESFREALTAAHPGASPEGLTVSASPEMEKGAVSFAWSGIAWSAAHLGRRLLWVGAGAMLSGLAAVCLRLFDPFADPRELLSAGGEEESDEGGATGPTRRAGGVREEAGRRIALSDLSPAAPAGAALSFVRTVRGELKLLLSGRRWWWYLGLAGANAAALFVSSDAAAIPLLAAWIIPLPLWSELGCRERLHGTEALVFSGPGPRLRLLPAQLAAGIAATLLVAAVPLGRMAMTGDAPSLLAAGAGALFIPALAYCLGTWSGREKTFQAVYLVLWYVGPANEVPPLDFMGVTGGALEAGATPGFLAAAAALTILAWAGRGRRIRAVERA